MTLTVETLKRHASDAAAAMAGNELFILEQLAAVNRRLGPAAALRILSTANPPFKCAPHLADALTLYLASFRPLQVSKETLASTEYLEAQARVASDVETLVRMHDIFESASINAAVLEASTGSLQ